MAFVYLFHVVNVYLPSKCIRIVSNWIKRRRKKRMNFLCSANCAQNINKTAYNKTTSNRWQSFLLYTYQINYKRHFELHTFRIFKMPTKMITFPSMFAVRLDHYTTPTDVLDSSCRDCSNSMDSYGNGLKTMIRR